MDILKILGMEDEIEYNFFMECCVGKGDNAPSGEEYDRMLAEYREKLKGEEMSIKIFKNYGCLAHEKMIVYTYGNPEATAKCSDIITVKIPDGWKTYESIAGETILTAPDRKNYTVHEVLCGDEHPCFRDFENGKRIRLEVV